MADAVELSDEERSVVLRESNRRGLADSQTLYRMNSAEQLLDIVRKLGGHPEHPTFVPYEPDA